MHLKQRDKFDDDSSEKKPAKTQESEEVKAVKEAFARVSKTSDGVVLFRYLMRICGFKESSIVGNAQSGELSERSTMYNEMRRSVYIDVRKCIPSQRRDFIERDCSENQPDEEILDL